MKEELYQRVASLSDRQQAALVQKLQQLNSDAFKSDNRSTPLRLVGYVVAQANTPDLNTAALHAALKSKLPSYMVPAILMQLPELPLSPNGKIDVQALPLPDRQISQIDIASSPRTSIEKTLLQIWRDVLGVSAIGIHDNFFELGGDSILSIQIVSRSREAKLRLAPNQLFECPTIAELAAVVNQTTEVTAEQSDITGPVPLTPIQHWFFEQEMAAPEHWHQAILISIPPTTDLAARSDRVEQAIATLWTHHDALRLRFSPATNGWQQIHAAATHPPKIRHKDLSNLSNTEQHSAIKTCGSQLHAGLDLATGKALQAIHFTFKAQDPSWLLISVHHLVVDGVSWRILQRDLKALLDPSNSTVNLPAKTTAFTTWAETLVKTTKQKQIELDFWVNQLAQPQIGLPQDNSSTEFATEGTANTVTVKLGIEKTRALLHRVPAAYNTQINDLLLTALVQTLLQWRQKANNESDQTNSIRLDVESHGREQLIPGIDLSRTVGWFTAVYPIMLTLSPSNDPGESIKAIKEQLRQIPERGIGYGMMRYLADETTRHRLAQFAPSEVLFNYLGQLEMGESVRPPIGQSKTTEKEDHSHKDSVHIIKDIDLGQLRDARNRRSYLLEINAWVANNQLHLNWTHDAKRHQSSTISGVAHRYLKALENLIAHCSTVISADEPSHFTPSDFPDIDLTPTELDSLIGRLPEDSAKNIEAIYPLTQLQQSFLWNSLQKSSQAGLLHMRGTLHGDLDVALLKRAWATVIDRHFALRTSVHWQAISQPLQVVWKSVALPWRKMDGRSHQNPKQALAEFLESDRTQGFDFTQPPITRLTLIQLGDRQYEMIWSCHHLLLDGWSGALVINQVLDSYEALRQEEQNSHSANDQKQTTALSYQAYVRWLQQKDLTAAERFWKEQLQGFISPTPLPIWGEIEQSEDDALAPVQLQSQALSVEETTRLRKFLRSHHLTLNTLIQGTWACLLSIYNGQSDVLFGATVSGRQANLAGIESVVGLLINVLPTRIKVSHPETVLTWLKKLQSQQAATSLYAHVATAQIQSWSDCQKRLFSSLLVIENYPAAAADGHSLQLKNLQSGIISAYELTIVVKPGDRLELFANGKSATKKDMQALLSDFNQLLTTVIEYPESTLQQICDSVDKAHFLLESKTETKPQSSPPAQPPSEVNNLACNPLELKLTQIWESILGVSPLSTDASFFDLGGDSLKAVQIFNQMQQQLDCTLPLATLFQAPTIRQFAALLSQDQPTTWSSLVPIQPNGSKPPFFFHGGSADALTWAKFSQMLGPDQPFYALQRPDLDGSAIAPTTVEALAAACIKDIQTIQPSGPYILGGHCFGGAVAYEMASQLEAQGQTIASLIQIDAYCPNALPPSKLGQLQEQIQLTYFRLRKSLYYHGGRNLTQLPQKIWHRLKPSLTQPIPPHPAPPIPPYPPAPTPPTSTFPYENRYTLAHQLNIRAAERYHPKQHSHRYSGPIKIFRANVQILDWRFGHTLGWQAVAGKKDSTHSPTNKNRIETTDIPGLFGNLFNQRSGPLLAQQVKAHLDTIQ